jgi:hypothetical protein
VVRVAYADPPYIGQSKAHYANHPDYAGEVDHPALIQGLINDFPDGWALSCHTPSLRVLLPLCPEATRVMAWVKPFSFWKPGIRVGYCWEPVLVFGGRKRSKEQGTVRDWVSVNAYQDRSGRSLALRAQKAQGVGVPGRKPAAFCYWLFEVLGLQASDELVDLFPGSGAVTHAWEQWQASQPMLAPEDCSQLELVQP